MIFGDGNLLGPGGFRTRPTFSELASSAGGAPGASGRDSGAEGASGTADPTADTPPRPGMITAAAAVQEISNHYHQLVKLYLRIEQRYGVQGLGGSYPCDVVNTYNAAVRAYVQAAQSVFQQILARDPSAQIVQTLYAPDGARVTTYTGAQPLLPPTLTQPGCAQPPMLLSTGALAAAPLAPVIIRAAMLVIGIAVSATAAVGLYNMWLNRPESLLAQVEAHTTRLEAKLSCQDRRIAQLRATGQNVNMAEVDAYCEQGVGPAPPPPQPRGSSTPWLWIGVGAVGLIGVFAVFRWLVRRPGDFSGASTCKQLRGTVFHV